MAYVATQTEARLEVLEQQRQESLEKLEHLRTDLRNMAEPSADEGDTDAYEREKLWALAGTVERKLRSIEEAIVLAKNGTYGLCQTCGQRIEPARLEILPDATLCLECQRALERKVKRSRY